MKKVLAMVLAITMVLSLAACGGNKPAEQTTSAATEAPAGESTAAPATEPAQKEPTEIVMWSVRGGEDAEAMQRYIDDFNAAQSDYSLSMVYTGGYGDTLAKFQTSAAGDRPDLVDTAMEFVAYFRDNPDVYVPVQKFADEDSYDTGNILAHSRNGLTDTEGKLMGIPLGNSAVGFFYNTDLLEAAGINPETDLGSIEEIAAAADKLQANGVKYPIFVDYDSTSYNSVLAAQGLAMVDQNNGKDGVCTKCLIDEEPLKSATIKYFTTIQNMSKKGQMPPSGLSGSDLRQLFVNGELAMFCWTISTGVTIGDLCDWSMNFGFHPSYTIDAGAELKGQGAFGAALMIGNNNDDIRARGAWEFMKWLMKDENVVDFALVSSYLPITESGYNSAEYQAFLQEKLPSYHLTVEAQENSQKDSGVAWLPMSGDFEVIILDIITKVMDDTTYDPVQATQDLADRTNEAITLYRMSKGLD